MNLTNPAIPYRSIRDNIIKLLRVSKNTLNRGLVLGQFQKDTEQIKAGDYLPIASKNTIYPVILVKITEKTENWESIGRAGRKRPTITWKVIGIVRNPLNTTENDNDIMQLTENIEGIFRENIQIDNNIVLWCQPVRAVFNTTEIYDGQYFDIVLIDLETKYDIF